MLRVNPSLLDVAFFMTYPQLSVNVSHNIRSWELWPVVCVILSPGKYNMLRVNPSQLDVAMFMKYPHLSEIVSHNIPPWAIWPVFCVI